IGAGTMGNGIAHTFAQNGFKVNLVDISQEALDRGVNTISKNLDRIISKGHLTEAQKEETLNNITKNTSLENAVKSADLIVEAATENTELK
ncbi:3-hydroxybutyryl-CoA dehydrogenase, partial [Escherichia coli]|nr:3-hydroxybutyryl-CoA dehydrogenase [Escherichia coli]